jgi:hypothetical protein
VSVARAGGGKEAGPPIVRGDNPVALFARLQVVIGAEGLLGVALGEGAEIDKRGVGEARLRDGARERQRH